MNQKKLSSNTEIFNTQNKNISQIISIEAKLENLKEEPNKIYRKIAKKDQITVRVILTIVTP